HIVDTMARIPYRGHRTVADNLVDTSATILARFDRRPLKLGTRTVRSITDLFTMVNDIGTLFGPDLGISPEDSAFFGERIWQILTIPAERRLAEYEKVGWWEFIGAVQRSHAYQLSFGIGCTRSVAA